MPADSANASTAADTFTIELVQRDGFSFEVHFDVPSMPPLVTDEPPPLGHDVGPDPARLLAAAVVNCLSASLLFALRKFGNTPQTMRSVGRTTLSRNEHGRLRVGRIAVDLHLPAPASEMKSLPRVLAQYEDFCVVTQSVRAGVPVDVQVFDGTGALLSA